jgi:hypothetical protein
MGNAENKGAFCVFCRANVHDCSGRSSHAKHNHELSTVSGVYYTRTPGGSAPLRFFDPRGAHALVEALGAPLGVDTSTPPFVDGLSVDAVQGRLVTFPGWLLHSVDPEPPDASSTSTATPAKGDSSESETDSDAGVSSDGSADDGGDGEGDGEQSGEGQWRVSFSFNLHGEWRDTASSVLLELEGTAPAE